VARELLMLRHGKSDWNTDAGDFQRPLKNRGKRGAQRMGVWLWQQDLRPDLIISSPAERAITTAQKCCKSMGMMASDVIEDERIYAAPVDELLEVLKDIPADAGRIMLVGHNPGLEELLEFLVADDIPLPDDGKLLPTASLAHLEMPDDWQALVSGCATLRSIVRSRELPRGFPCPAPDGEELRDRPAYYYTQSAVIPYRVDGDGQTAFLVIGSSKKHHWVVPKGIKDPGLTPQQSAAREAWEEAGIRGEVSDEPLGHYMVEKWGAQCGVDVYAMRVSEIADDDDWEENHRQRHWLSAKKAAASLKQQELGIMLLDLAARLKD
jgi:phosphohistidine phosphatase